MPVMGIDPSLTHLGWVLLNEKEQGRKALLNHGTFTTTPSDGLMVQRLIMQRERVKKFLVDNKLKFVSMEAPVLEDFNSELLFALNNYLHEVFLNLGVFVIQIQPMTLKKSAKPLMNPHDVTKHHMVHQAKTELGMHGKRFSEHVSDAYFAGKMGSRFYQWHILREITDDDLTESEQHVFCGKHTFTRGVKKGFTEYTGIIYKPNERFWDYSKIPRKTKNIIKEIQNGHPKGNKHRRLLQKAK